MSITTITTNNIVLGNPVVALEDRVAVLEGKLERWDIVNRRLHDMIIDQQAQSTKYNLIFNFNRTSTDYGSNIVNEDCIGIISAFIENVMGYSTREAKGCHTPVAHRIGGNRGPNKFWLNSQLLNRELKF